MSNRPLNVGLVGGGKGAFIVNPHQKAIHFDGTRRVVAGALLTDPKIALEEAANWPYPIRGYGSYDEMIAANQTLPADQKLDYILIVTPNHVHFDPAVKAMKPGEVLVAVGTSCRHQIKDGTGRGALHMGLDFPADVGTPIIAAASTRKPVVEPSMKAITTAPTIDRNAMIPNSDPDGTKISRDNLPVFMEACDWIHRVVVTWLAGPGNTSLAHYPFGVALARGIVTMEEHDAGMSYARSYRIAMGGLPDRLEPTVARFQPSGGGEIPDRVENAATAHWRAGSAALIRLSRQTKDDLENLVLFDRWPLWLDPQHMPRPKDLRQQARIKAGLAVLVGLV